MYRSKLGLPKKITFGVEIEFANANYEWVELAINEWNRKNHVNCEEYWDIYQEASVIIRTFNSILGGEVSSPILIDSKTTWKLLKEMCQLLCDKGATCTEKTGAHIHFGSQILGNDITHWFLFLKLWSAYETVIDRFSAGIDENLRVGTFEFAKPIRKKYLSQLQQVDEKDITSFSSFLNIFHFERKQYAINLLNVVDGNKGIKNTIEIRTPNGTINPEIWQNNVNFFAHLLMYCTNPKFEKCFIEDVLYEKEKARATDLADMIFLEEADKKAFIKQYRKEF